MEEKDTVVVEFNQDNLDRFLSEYYKTHKMRKNKKTKKDEPIIKNPVARSMNDILIITNRIVQNDHKQHRGEYCKMVIKELGLEKTGISSTNLKIHFTFGTRTRHDLDNFLAGIKEFLDSFSDLGVIVDDNYEIIKTITASASYEKDVYKMVFSFENCEYDLEAMEIAMETERIKKEKCAITNAKKKEAKKVADKLKKDKAKESKKVINK